MYLTIGRYNYININDIFKIKLALTKYFDNCVMHIRNSIISKITLFCLILLNFFFFIF